MTYRHDHPRCPTCGEAAYFYDCLWDYLYCRNHHSWDGPINDPLQKGMTMPSPPSLFPRQQGSRTR